MNSVEGDNQWRIVDRSLTIWLVLIVAEIAHGILRAIVLVPVVGEFRSNQIGVFTGSAIILATAYFTIRWVGAKRPKELLLVGLIWLVLTVAFEVLFGRFVAMAAKMLDKAPGEEWETIIALARFGGLRAPSEVMELKWEDIDFVGRRMCIFSPKLAHKKNKGIRYCPIFPELLPYLENLAELAKHRGTKPSHPDLTKENQG